ncbi:hypothetical protein ACM26V_04970 [Salipaludibacillus sp. HK11]|uniref:hypothetical protein n=1 Tax=Salipaludibacillus sp. HK11 TaxID=3394320 RepID=UPI0039FC97D0
MSLLISSILYLFILFGISTVFFVLLIFTFPTNEPVIVYLLTLIISHLMINNLTSVDKGTNWLDSK